MRDKPPAPCVAQNSRVGGRSVLSAALRLIPAAHPKNPGVPTRALPAPPALCCCPYLRGEGGLEAGRSLC